ncbi:MAG: amidohydrolase family protein [Chloroflexi bacterium]|nr:amidohydrolase family protein [Chloroflexota bacterium]
MVVDSHCHASLEWYEPIETLLFEMDRNGVDAAILIQINGQYDNAYQAECVKRYPGRFASVVMVDHAKPDAPQTLERLHAEGASGVRLAPTVRSPGDDPLAIWHAAERLGLSISCGGKAADFATPAFAQLVEQLPRAKVVVEHLGGLSRADDNAQREQVFKLARFSNVYMKVTGVGEFAARAMPVKAPFPFEEPIPTFLEQAYQAFSPARLMWGSDFPPVASREGYGRALQGCRDQFANKPRADLDRIFDATARAVFPIRT